MRPNSNYTSLKRFICLKINLNMFPQYCILSSTAIHCRSLPLICHHIEDATKMLWKGGRRLLLNLGKLSGQQVVEKRVIYLSPPPYRFKLILYLFCLVYHSFLSMSEDKERNGKNGCNVLIQEFNQLVLTWSIQGTSFKGYIFSID